MNNGANTDSGGLGSLSGFAQIVDASVLARAQRGDMQAFATLYVQFGRPCYGLALRLTGNAAHAEDLVQEVFLKLIDSIRSYRGDAPFGAWLKRMTANATVDQLRRNKRFVDADPEAMFAASEACATNSAQKLDAAALLQRLPPRARAVVVLHELEGYTHTEIAKLFGQSESYSKSILARGLQRLHAAATPDAEA
ncbi:MAG: sigma-70 family RNA polymerase sigma factor [Proteobacteria bacterium]|uniref:RNA polymerase sigma factor n=1 Tax=Rudaea sp. TaxID=2136325 RepID=UPI003783F18D|nr:sigma-70 family RNA polymerase sigma factor [Pseudomonadota bacterium]